jgi:arginase family enzyme
MSFSVAPLLLHSEHVPLTARHALRAAYEAPVEERISHLESAARILYCELDLDCVDARELVGLSTEGACG